jgi:hypothetical protein
MFFHDALNTAGAIRGYLQLLAEELCGHGSYGEELRQLAELSEQLVEEIESQRDLVYAEAGDLAVRPQVLSVRPFLENLRALYAGHGVAAGRQIEIGEAWNGQIVTDGRLLARVLGNMIKNALEAAAAGEAVTLRAVDYGDAVEFSVHNLAVMPEQVQLQVFKRSFSTKAEAGRGIGTHSMKLFGERYLGGRVGFTSRHPEGTTFHVRLPKAIPGEARSRPSA